MGMSNTRDERMICELQEHVVMKKSSAVNMARVAVCFIQRLECRIQALLNKVGSSRFVVEWRASGLILAYQAGADSFGIN